MRLGALAFRRGGEVRRARIGVTLSRNQYEYAQEKIREKGIADRCEVRLQDYRDSANLAASTRSSGIGVIEHVGRQDMQRYFALVASLLKDGGLMLNHGISSASGQPGGGRGSAISSGRCVFPNGELAHISLALARRRPRAWS